MLLFIFVWITSFVWSCLWLFVASDIFDAENGTSSRNLSDLISNNQYSEVKDLMSYNKKSIINYVKKNGLNEKAFECFGMFSKI